MFFLYLPKLNSPNQHYYPPLTSTNSTSDPMNLTILGTLCAFFFLHYVHAQLCLTASWAVTSDSPVAQYWNFQAKYRWLPFPPPGDLTQGMEPTSHVSAWQWLLPLWPTWKPISDIMTCYMRLRWVWFHPRWTVVLSSLLHPSTFRTQWVLSWLPCF